MVVFFGLAYLGVMGFLLGVLAGQTVTLICDHLMDSFYREGSRAGWFTRSWSTRDTWVS